MLIRLNRNSLAALLALLGITFSPSLIAQRNPGGRALTPPITKPKAKTEAEAKTIETLTASALKSVVVISHFGRDGKEDGVGAGFVVSSNGLIATCLHVIGEARRIRVRLPSGQTHEVTEIYAWDRKLDLAVVRIAAKGLPTLPLGDSDTLRQGAVVIALGNPLGLEHSVVQGVLSAHRELDDISMLQLAMPIEPGNSGGPLLDLSGQVHGILTLKSALTPNLGFAMPANLLRSILDRPNPVPIERWLTIGALNPKEWTPLMGARWTQKAGRVQVEGSGKGFGGRSLCLSQKPVPSPAYELAVTVRLEDESGAAGLIFASDGNDQHYGFYPSAGQLRLTRFEGPTVYSWSILKQVPSEHYHRGDWNHLRVRVEPGKIQGYVNGHLVIESDDDVFKEGRVGLAKFRDTRAEFKGFQVGTNLSNPNPPPSDLPPETIQRVLEQRTPDADSTLLSELEKKGPSSSAYLNQRANELERDAHHLRSVAATLHRKSIEKELLNTLDRPEERIDLLRAALLIARLDNPDVDVDSYQRQVGEMATEISKRLASDADDQSRLNTLRNYLFAENGFHGSRSDYYNRANSYLNEVLDDREGLPITLSVLFLQLAERIGLRGVTGLPLPGHFMVRYVPQTGNDQIIDVYNGGQILSRTEAQERVIEATGEGFVDTEYRAASKREIVIRMLRNLLGLSERHDSAMDSLRYLDLIVALTPNSVRDRLDRARLRLQAGDNAGAKIDCKWLLDEQPAGVDLERIAELYRSL